jgi:hypothetical protein
MAGALLGRVGTAGSILWTLDRDPQLRSPIAVVVVFDREPPVAEVTRRFGVLCRRVRHFRSTVVPPSVPWDLPRWREDESFEVANHVRHLRVALPGTLRSTDPPDSSHFVPVRVDLPADLPDAQPTCGPCPGSSGDGSTRRPWERATC